MVGATQEQCSLRDTRLALGEKYERYGFRTQVCLTPGRFRPGARNLNLRTYTGRASLYAISQRRNLNLGTSPNLGTWPELEPRILGTSRNLLKFWLEPEPQVLCEAQKFSRASGAHRLGS